MPNGDIPEVEAEILALGPLLRADWGRRSGAGIEALIDEVERAERAGDLDDPTEEVTAALVIAALLALRRRIDSPIPKTTRRRIRAGAHRIILAGMRSTGGFGRLRSRGPTVTRATNEAVRELVFLHRERIEGDRIRERLDAAIRDFSESEKARRTKRERRRDEQAEKDRRAEEDSAPMSKSERRRLKAKRKREAKERERERQVTGPARDRKEWAERTRRVVKDAGVSQAVADVWAYRVHSIGVFLAAKATRIETLVAVNPKDAATTRFCNWVHGKTIQVVRVERQVNDFTSAVKDGDRDGAVKSWPFINQSTSGIRRARSEIASRSGRNLATITPNEVFRRFFAKVGLPPYHWGCRTRPVPRIIFLGA